MSPGETLFRKVAALSGVDPPEARRLALSWRKVLRSEPGWAYRTRSAGLRLSGRWREAAEMALRAASVSGDASFGFGAVDSFGRAGLLEEALAAARRLARGLGAESKARLWVNVGNVNLWADRYPAARRAFRYSLTHLSADDPIRDRARLGLSTAELYGGDPRVAGDIAGALIDSFQDRDETYFAFLAELNVVHSELLTGRAEQAWLRLRRLQQTEGYEGDAGRVHEFLGDALVALNLLEDAEAEYQTALTSPGQTPLNRANCLFALARLKSDRRLAKQAERAYRRLGNRVWAVGAALIGESNPQKLEALIREARALKSPRWTAEAQLAQGTAKRLPYPDLELARLQRSAQTLAQHRRLFDLWKSARAEVATTAVAMRYFAGKESVLTDYLELLLAKPTPSRIAEARRVILETRAITLLDEILSAEGVSPEVRDALDQIRIEAALDRRPDTRRAPHAGGKLPLFVRQTTRRIATSDSGAAVFWQGDGRTYRLDDAVTALDLKEGPKWLEFELMTGTDPFKTIRLASEVVEMLGPMPRLICPDGHLWALPWALIAPNSILCLSPSFDCPPTQFKPGRIVVLHGDHPGLPAAREEVAGIEELFPDAEIVGTAAEAREKLRGDIALLHVAGHVRFNRENPMLSFVEFPDGPLFSVEIAQSPARIGTAVLSACDTGAVSLVNKTEPDGLVRAVLARGAKAVVGAQWPLHDETAAEIIQTMYHRFVNGTPLDMALDHARQNVRMKHPHPREWASLVLFGGYA